MMSKKNLMIIIVSALCLISLAQAEEKGNKAEADYRIEVAVDTSIDGMLLIKPTEKEIKFISPNGRIIKTLSFDYDKDWWKVIIAPTFKYLIKVTNTPAEWVKDSIGEPIKIREAKVKFSYINAKGEIKWGKEFEIISTMEETDEDDIMPYFFKISLDGDKILLVRSQGQEYEEIRSEVVVFDTTGQEVTPVCKAPLIETPDCIKIAPDGKIVAAEGYYLPKKGVKYDISYQVTGTRGLFFLDVETGFSKIIEGYGEINGREWSVSAFPLRNRKILLTLHKFPKSVTLPFDEIPEDLSTLFNQGGEK